MVEKYFSLQSPTELVLRQAPSYAELAVEYSVLDIRFSFDVGRSMLDVGRSSCKTTLYGINKICGNYSGDRLKVPPGNALGVLLGANHARSHKT